jgi:S1-C subfamily serine protease
VGAGIGSLLKGKGRQYYILEHKVSSRYHRAGEAQEIIVDQAEIGRDPRCAVRFDDYFETVSRRHAVIVKEEDHWKLVPLSRTNPTFLNGKRVLKEWYLQNGDEIQCAVNGPRLGFIIPAGDKSTAGSIGLSRRLSLFRQQALRPYKRGLVALAACLFLAAGGGTGFILRQERQHAGETRAITGQIDELVDKNGELAALAAATEEARRRQDSVITALKNRPAVSPSTVVAGQVAAIKKSVFFILTTTYVRAGGQEEIVGTSSGTGFLLGDGRFVTARHCVERWLYDLSETGIKVNAHATTYPGHFQVYSIVKAFSGNGRVAFTLKSSDFTIDRSQDVIHDYTSEDGPLKMRIPLPLPVSEQEWVGSEAMYSRDWAYARTSQRSGLTADYTGSATLRAGEEIHVLGFPAGLGVVDGEVAVEPIYNKMTVARDNLNSAGCIMVSQGIERGNSGGPVLLLKGGKLVVVGIVSRGDARSQTYNHIVPIRQIR